MGIVNFCLLLKSFVLWKNSLQKLSKDTLNQAINYDTFQGLNVLTSEQRNMTKTYAEKP